MAIEKGKLQLEKYKVDKFMNTFKKGEFKGQRLGQAFYDHFRLERLVDQAQLRGLYQLDGEQAKSCIGAVFKFN